MLRVLAVCAQPYGLALLDLEREKRGLVEALNAPGVQVVLLQEARIEAMLQTLLEGEFHILHFMGHAGLDTSTGEGVLLFERDGGPSTVSGAALAMLLSDIRTLRLVFLDVDRTVWAVGEAGHNPLFSVTTALLRIGIPAVIAMHRPISDSAAIAFNQTVYRRLASGDSVDIAVTAGRLSSYSVSPGTTEWAAPVLFTCTSPLRLLAPKK